MGSGNHVHALTVSGKLHDDFEPFEKIATRWGQEVFPAALARCNARSAG